jgi:hypothetical protein
MKSNCHLWFYVAETFSEWEIFQWNFVQKNKTHILFSKLFLIHAIYEKKWKYFIEPARPQMTIWPMRMTSRIPKTTNIPSAYVVLTVFHCNIGSTKAPQCYFIRTFHVLFFAFGSHKTVEIDKFRDVCIVVESVLCSVYIFLISSQGYIFLIFVLPEIISCLIVRKILRLQILFLTCIWIFVSSCLSHLFVSYRD